MKLASVFLALGAFAVAFAAEPAVNRFEKNVLAYEAADKISPPPQGAILLAGDSQFFRWRTVHEDLPGYRIVNRGIDSFQTSDLIHYVDRLVLPHHPRLIVLHVGGNDVHNGRSPEQVLADFKTFVGLVRAKLPKVPIIYSSITPGPGRWDEAELRKRANQTVKDYIATQSDLKFVDLWDAMLTADGKPREDIWVEDRVHPNHAGYQIRARLTLPLLGTPDFPAPAPSAVAALPNVTLQPSETFNLWPAAAPGETGAIGPEKIVPQRPRPFDQITDVSVPTLSVFRPAPGKANGTAMLVIPGGGLDRLAIEHEGYEVAAWLNDLGVTAFLLKYRVPARDPQQRWKAGLQDAQRAMGLIRFHSAQWGVDPASVGSIGFSAGGEINVMLSVYASEDRQYPVLDAADLVSSRPDFNIAIYGGGFAALRDGKLREDIAKRINAATPPMFIAHAFDDAALNSTILFTALKQANVPSELHIFNGGGHGFGVRDSGLTLVAWRESCANWLAAIGALDRSVIRAYARELASVRNQTGASLPRLGARVANLDFPAAFAAQRWLVREVVAGGDTIAGYKGGFVTAAVQSSMKLDGPMHGVLFKSGRLEAAAEPTIPLDAKRPLFVETEIGYIIATDIGTQVRTPRQAMSAVEAIAPVIELPVNVGVPMGGNASTADVVAANIGSARFIVGSSFPPETVADLDAFAVTLTRDGERLHTGTGGEVKDGQAANLMRLINQIVAQGRELHRGDIIICGALGGAKPGVKGRYVADYGALGRIVFTLE